MLKFDANLFRHVAGFVSTEETRYYLCGVQVKPHHDHGVLLTATDGHRLVVAWDETGSADETAIVSLSPEALKACKPGRYETRFVKVEGDTATVFSHLGSGETDATPVGVSTKVRIDGIFPDIERVVMPIDQATGEPFPTFNGAYVASFGKLATALNKDGQITIVGRDKTGPALVLFPNSPHVYAVLMPMRGQGDANTVPAWYFAAPKSEATEAA